MCFALRHLRQRGTSAISHQSTITKQEGKVLRNEDRQQGGSRTLAVPPRAKGGQNNKLGVKLVELA